MKTQAPTTTGNTSKIKVNGYNSTFLHAKRDRKRWEAEERQAKFDLLTPVQKYQRIKFNGGSARELARIIKRFPGIDKEITTTVKLPSVPVSNVHEKFDDDGKEKKAPKTAKKPTAKKKAVTKKKQ